MPKMTDSRRKKIQAKQRQMRAAQKREKKAARRAQRSNEGPLGSETPVATQGRSA
jgi:hypothetical protein